MVVFSIWNFQIQYDLIYTAIFSDKIKTAAHKFMHENGKSRLELELDKLQDQLSNSRSMYNEANLLSQTWFDRRRRRKKNCVYKSQETLASNLFPFDSWYVANALRYGLSCKTHCFYGCCNNAWVWVKCSCKNIFSINTEDRRCSGGRRGARKKLNSDRSRVNHTY